MLPIQDAFKKHTDQEFPPKFVFFIEMVDGYSTILSVATDDIHALEKTHTYWCDISEIQEYLGIFDKTGNLPILIPIEV